MRAAQERARNPFITIHKWLSSIFRRDMEPRVPRPQHWPITVTNRTLGMGLIICSSTTRSRMKGIARPQINWASDPSRSHDMALVYIGIVTGVL